VVPSFVDEIVALTRKTVESAGTSKISEPTVEVCHGPLPSLYIYTVYYGVATSAVYGFCLPAGRVAVDQAEETEDGGISASLTLDMVVPMAVAQSMS
jgi:hypothetical protein